MARGSSTAADIEAARAKYAQTHCPMCRKTAPDLRRLRAMQVLHEMIVDLVRDLLETGVDEGRDGEHTYRLAHADAQKLDAVVFAVECMRGVAAPGSQTCDPATQVVLKVLKERLQAVPPPLNYETEESYCEALKDIPEDYL